MLKIIKKASLFSLFFFSFVCPMRHIAQVPLARTLTQSAPLHSSLVARCPESFILVMAMMPIMMAKNEVGHAQCLSKVKVMEGDPSISQKEYEELLEQLDIERLEYIKKQVFIAGTEFVTNVQDETHKFMQNCSSFEHYELQAQQAYISQNLLKLKIKYESLMDQNSHIDCIVNLEKDGLSYKKIFHEVQDRFSCADYHRAKDALDLKLNIKSYEAIMHAIDSKIKKDSEDFENKLKFASFDTIQKEIMPKLTVTKKSITSSLVQEENKLKDIQAQLKILHKKLEWIKFKEFFKIYDDSQRFFKIKKNDLNIKEEETTRKIQFLNDKQKECYLQIERVQKIHDVQINNILLYTLDQK